MKIGDTWNNWTVTSFLGEGSFGKVYGLERNEYGHTYESALKVIRIPRSEDEVTSIRNTGMDEKSVTDYFKSMVNEIVSELALMAELRGNTNIVSYEDHSVIELEDEFGWEIYLRMELLTPLWKYIESKPFGQEDTVKLGIDLCKALEVCAKSNIIHRDIKPENIFVSRQGDFKLGDFGIAKQMEKATAEMSRKGTVSYMAPEVYKGQKDYDASVDTYSLGIVLYRLLNYNRLPFLPPFPESIQYQDTQNALARRFSGEPLPAPACADRKLADIIVKACSFDPADRFSSPTAMRRALESVLSGDDEATIAEGWNIGGTEDTDKTVALINPGLHGQAYSTGSTTGNSFSTGGAAGYTEVGRAADTGSTDASAGNGDNNDNTSGTPAKPPKPVNKKLIAGIIAALVIVAAGIAYAMVPKVDYIRAEYTGDIAAGTVINNDSPITVTVNYSNDKTEEVTSGWTVEKTELEPGYNSAEVNYKGKSASLVVNSPCFEDGKFVATVEQITNAIDLHAILIDDCTGVVQYDQSDEMMFDYKGFTNLVPWVGFYDRSRQLLTDESQTPDSMLYGLRTDPNTLVEKIPAISDLAAVTLYTLIPDVDKDELIEKVGQYLDQVISTASTTGEIASQGILFADQDLMVNIVAEVMDDGYYMINVVYAKNQ